jgi:hypothetical protein
MIITGQRLLDLLPAVYRLRDAEIAAATQPTSGETPPVGPLEALLTLVAEQLSILSADLDQLYEDQFIETCASWVIPYIGDLIGYQPVNGVAPAVASQRAEVAHTISFRRRKGTVLVLEQLARDVTGWGAHAVEFFRLLTGTQYINHIRPASGGSPDLRQWQVAEYLDTSFDAVSHNVDVRSISSGAARQNIRNIGIFLWSTYSYTQTLSQAAPASGAPQCFRFSTLGADMPLFTRPSSQGATLTAAGQPVNVPARLHRRVLCQDLQSGTASAYYGTSLLLTINGVALQPSQIAVCNLSGLDGHWINLPTTGSSYAAAVDPELGRIALPPAPAGGAAPTVQASFRYGFSADMAGGEYPRSASFAPARNPTVIHVPGDHPTLHEALAALPLAGGIVEVSNSATYTEPAGLNVSVPADATIELRAADGAHPTLILGAAINVTGGTLSSFYLNGFLITCPPPAAGASVPIALLHVPATSSNQLARLNVTHCTFVPGWSLTSTGSPASPSSPAMVAELPNLAISVAKTILGSIRIHPSATATLADSILDATSTTSVAYSGLDAISAGGALSCIACTLIGKVHTTVLTLVSNSIVLAGLTPTDTWSAALWADRRQQGCVRFSYLPASTITPQPSECASQAFGSPDPQVYTLRYGQPEYAKLLVSTDDVIRRGADDGGEMGAFHFVLAPLRESDLRVRLAEYLAVGMECGLIYAT